MPPKRIHSSVATTPTPPPLLPTTTQTNTAITTKAVNTDGAAVPSKKAKILNDEKDNDQDNPKYVQPADDTRPMCRYGTNCYRKNPDHFRQFRHPLKSDSLDEIRSEHEKMKEKARQDKLCSSLSSSSISSSSSSSLMPSSSSSPPPKSSSSSSSSTPKAKPSTLKKVSSSLGDLDPSKPDDKVDQFKFEAYKVNILKIIIYNL